MRAGSALAADSAMLRGLTLAPIPTVLQPTAIIDSPKTRQPQESSERPFAGLAVSFLRCRSVAISISVSWHNNVFARCRFAYRLRYLCRNAKGTHCTVFASESMFGPWLT